ncbi:MAG: arabinogalactan endo-1,4-beta-galactosidase [Bacteroidales bacterium]|nr:arabinogalactan endo-1,4-beta-galactosidase [Bacteroidales bacterium]
MTIKSEKILAKIILAIAATMTVVSCWDGGDKGGEKTVIKGLSDGYYDVSFKATRALEGDVVYVTAQSRFEKERMTSLQYGNEVEHIIRGVKVKGGKCVIKVKTAGKSPAQYKITDGYKLTRSTPREFLFGGDYARLNMQLAGGAIYKENGEIKDAVDIAVDNGWNILRLRIFNDPGNENFCPSCFMTPGFVTKTDAYRLALKAKNAGLKIWLSFHYSDYWTDPARQNRPHEWVGYSFDQLIMAVHGFTYEVMKKMKEQDTTPDYVSVGNENNGGIFYGGGTEGKDFDPEYYCRYDKFAEIFKAGAQAVREIAPQTKIAVHVSNPQCDHSRLLDALDEADARYDIIGTSYYPFWTKTMTTADLRQTMDSIAVAYDKQVMIMETGANWNSETYYHTEGQLKDQGIYESIYPASKENQRNFMQELINDVKKSERIIGLLYWDPIAVKLTNWTYSWNQTEATISNYDNGTVNQNSALFDFEGNSLPAWEAFKFNN